MKQVTVKRIVPINDDPYFEVRLDGKTEGIFSFKIDEADDSIYNEEKNRLKAMELAAKIENGDIEKEEIIYQTKL